MDFLTVAKALRASWDKQTSQSDFWTPDTPSMGQCAVSSMVVQHFFGGEILRGETNLGMVHYWNQIDGMWLDTTHAQFEPDEYIIEHIVRPPDYLYRFQDTIDRYELLLSRVNRYLGIDSTIVEW